MWSKKANEFPLHNPKFSQNRNSIRDLTTAWNSFSQTKATLQHIENKLEVAPISTARLDTVMEKKPSISTTRKISRKGMCLVQMSSSQNKESSFRRPLRATTLDSNVSKKGHIEFRQPLSSFRDPPWSPSYKTSCQLEARHLKYKEAGDKAEGSGMIYDKGEPGLHGRDLKSPSSTEETVVRYLNDHPAINALQSSDVVNPTKLEEESEESKGEEYTKTSPSSIIQNELKELQLVESSASSASTSSAHRLDILKQHQHGDKLEKLKERIRKQWECSDELSVRGHNPEYSDHPVTITAPENIVTPKIRKVATAPMAPSYKGFNPSEAKIRTPDGKVWCEEEFLNLSRELCQDLEFQLAEDLTAIKTPIEKKEKKGHKPVRKTQKIAQLSSPYSKSGGANTISTASWRDGQRLAKKILGPVPKIEQPNAQMLSSDRNEKINLLKLVSHMCHTLATMPVAVKSLTTCPERSSNKIRGKNNLKKKDAAPHNEGLGDDHVNKDFLPVEIRGILDDLQLDSVAQDSEMRNEICQNQESEPPPFSRSHSPGKKKSDKVPTNEDTQFILKKRHYDADEVRQYIVRQQEERKKRQSEEKKAQKEATQQKNKRLQELYKKQKEAVANKTKATSTSETVGKHLQETYSKLFMEQTLLENPALSVQEVQSKPGYQPSGESDKENKAQERPVSASSSSDMSLSEPPYPLVRDNTLEPLRIHPEKLSSITQFPSSKSVLNGAFFSQLLSLDNMGILQKDFESVTSSRRSHNTAMGSMSSTPQPFMSSTVQPTINHYKHKLDRIEALKATAASLSNRIESEAKKLAGAGINYEAAWHTEHDLLDQGATCWAKASSPPVREDDVFSARLQKMLATCNSHTTFDDNLPGMENLNEFKKLPESISPHTGALGLPGNNIPEEILGNLSQKQTCSAGTENKPVVPNDSGDSISEGLLSDGLLSEEEGEKPYNSSLKIAEGLNEKEFCVADKTGFETIKEFQKEAENYLPIFTQIRNGPKPWEELVKGSPHSVINIFTKSYQLCGKGQGSSKHRPLLPAMSPPNSIASYEDDFISSQGTGTSVDKKSTPEHRYIFFKWMSLFPKLCTDFTGSMRFSPAGLQHRMSAELNYLSTIEESVHQISDIERVRGISLAQQESVSLALILKSQQQRHERDLALLKLKAEQEMLENQRNLEEAKQKAAQAHAESLLQLAQSHQEAAETLQDTKSKIATHQLETALLTADTARQIREMTEHARFQISDAVGTTAAPVTTLFDQERKHSSAFIKQEWVQLHEAVQIHSVHYISINSGLLYESPSSKETKKLSHHEKPSSSIEEEAPTAINDSLQNISIPSIHDERDSTSVATEYSLKFDESMTEDEIEEQSFRSLLPSESHRRINLKKRNHQIYSDEEASPGKPALSPIKEQNLPFSGGQDSFSKFTMEMVRQYMREEEMRAAHQSSLLRLREKALKEKTKAELAWLEHQKRHLRDKGEDDKMPPIRKKQRGLLLKLQQEKAEIKRLQEANKAARKERQLILKQQEEIERIRQTTMKLQEKLKSAGENKEHRSEDDKKQTHCSSPQPTDAEAYSPSSISSSETSSIMQKLKKMRKELNEDFETTPTAKPQIKTPSSVTEKPKLKPPPLHRSETSKSWKSLTDSERSRGSLESIVCVFDFKQSHTASTVLKILRKSTAESDNLDSLLPSAILKDLGNTSKISPISLNKSEDAVSYDSPTTRSIVQETAESKELEVEIASQAYEISNASTELLEKNQFVLECITVQEIKEMPSERFNDDESITSIKSVSEQISICEEQSYSSDFEESSLGTDISKSEIVLTEYQRDTFQAPTLSFRQDTGSQGENSLYTRPPRSESPGFESEDEISECLSEKSLSVADSIQSERLLELKSPTEFVKNKECGDVEKEPFDDDDDLCWASSFKASSEKQEDILLGFSIGDRVLVSNVYPGTLKFKGWTNFDKGFWAGVELDEPEGNNNGSYNGIQYFDCKEKHGIFAPPQKISLFSKGFGNDLDSNENSFFKHEQDNQHKTNQEGLDTLEKEKNKRNTNEKPPRESSALKGSIGAGDYVKFNKPSDCLLVINTVDGFDQETSGFDSPKSSKNDNGMLPPAISNIHKEDSAIEVGGDLDSNFPEKWKQQSVWQEQTENRFSLSNLEKSATPLLDLLTKERSQLEAQLKVPSQEKEDLLDREERVGLLADSLLQGFVKDTVSQFQQIKKARNEKIHFSNQGLDAVQENNLATNEQERFLVVSELDDGEEVSSPDMCPRPESPVFGASGQEELAKRLAELELSREFLNVLGDDQDWFDEDFGLSSHKLPQNQAEESAVLPKIELPKVSPKPCEEPLAAPYVAEEVEELVHTAAEKLWKCKELGHDLQTLSNPRDMNESPQNDDIETVSKQIYKKAVFDLTREIFEEIFAEDPNLNQPLWMKPSRIISGYFRRVKDPSDLEEIKVFITAEVLKLLNLRKESNNKTDWQKMMKFGRKKKDRVDHILVQELHEEEAQWVNYDEDELYVKMQLADGIFEALIRDTIDLLNQIFEKQKMFV
uniref:Centrosomal protein 350 n=1 Tax=Naja naja TaxID=35670 RepID=A0A8C6Y9W9_NAJNA